MYLSWSAQDFRRFAAAVFPDPANDDDWVSASHTIKTRGAIAFRLGKPLRLPRLDFRCGGNSDLRLVHLPRRVPSGQRLVVHKPAEAFVGHYVLFFNSGFGKFVACF